MKSGDIDYHNQKEWEAIITARCMAVSAIARVYAPLLMNVPSAFPQHKLTLIALQRLIAHV